MRLEDLFRAPFRHVRKMAVVWVVIVASVVTVTVLTRKSYESRGMLYVRLGRTNATLDPTAIIGQGSVVALPPSREDELNTVVQVLLSRSLAEKVVDSLGADYVIDEPEEESGATSESSESPEWLKTVMSVWNVVSPFDPSSARERAIKKFMEEVKIGAVKRTSIITLGYEASSPEKTQAILAKLVDCYLEQHSRLNRTPGSHEFLTAQAGEVKSTLTKTEEALRTLKNESAVSSIGDQQHLLETRLGALHDKLLAAEAEERETSAEVAKLQSAIKDLPETLVSAKVEGHANEAADLMRQQLFTLEIREKELLNKYQDDNFLVKDIRRQIENVKTILTKENASRTQTTTSTSLTYETLRLNLVTKQSTLAALEAKIAAVRGQLEETHTQIAKLNDRSLDISRLEREAAVQESTYRKYAENLDQTRLDEALEEERITNVVVAQAPTFEDRIARPRKLINYALGILFATVASFAVAILAEYLDRSVRTPEQVEDELGLPTLISLPRFAESSRAVTTSVARDEESHVHHARG